MSLYARLWTDILDDPKLLRAARIGAKNLDKLPWLIAFAKRADADGRLEISGEKAEPADIARSIPNATERQIAGAIDALLKLGVLVVDPDGVLRFTSWEFRNAGKTSDSRDAVAERVRRHRERRRQQRNADGNGGNVLQALRGNEQESREKRVESREKRVERKSGVVGKDSLQAPRQKRAPLPPAAREFGKHFYHNAPRDRQEDVYRQLLATLNGAGAQFRKGVRVFAGSPQRLETKCREVIADPPHDHDRAIVVLLTKLCDVSDDSPTEKAVVTARTEEQRDEADTAQRLGHAQAWLELNPEASVAIDKAVEAEFIRNPVKGDFGDIARRMIYRSALLKAWTDAGEPIVQLAADQ